LENKSAKDSAVIEDLRHKSHYEIEVFNNKFYRKKITKRTLEDSVTILMGDKTKLKLEEIKDFGDITELDTKKLFGF
jgi:translation initiation factor IF-1